MVRRIFEEGQEKPPLARNMPPVAGAIKWCRGLLVRLRRTWLRLQALSPQLEAIDPGKRAAAAMTGAGGCGLSVAGRDSTPLHGMSEAHDCARAAASCFGAF